MLPIYERNNDALGALSLYLSFNNLFMLPSSRCIQSFRLQVNRTPSDRCYRFVTALSGPFSVR
jgi:hypothetical protein